MGNNVYSMDHFRAGKRNEGLVVAKGLFSLASVMLLVGSILFVQNVGAFTLSNLALMASISLLIAGTLILAAGLGIVYFIPKQNKDYGLSIKNLKNTKSDPIHDLI